MKKMKEAYMTVEATLMVPFVMYLTVFVIYIGFYQYDRCLMRQDAYRIALAGSSLYRTDNTEVYNRAFEKATQETADKYIITDCGFSLKVQRDVEVTLEGQSGWDIEECMYSRCINPVFFIRSVRQILPDSQTTDDNQ